MKLRHTQPLTVLRRYLRRCHRNDKNGGFPFDKERDRRVMMLLGEIERKDKS